MLLIQYVKNITNSDFLNAGLKIRVSAVQFSPSALPKLPMFKELAIIG
jgi:hypothetical protein